MNTKTRKAKGKGFQNDLTVDIRAKFNLPDEDVVSNGMGQPGMDIQLSERARQVFPFAVECKRQESLNIWESLKQAEYNAEKENLVPAVAFKRNYSDTYIALPWDAFLKLAAGEDL
jgi:hypothetical protein